MKVQENLLLAPLNEIRAEDVARLYKETIHAILVIAISYVTGAVFFTVLFSLRSDYWYIAFIFPLLGNLWIYSFGAKYVNNRYGMKKTSGCIWLYEKKRQSYSTFVSIHVLIFLVSSIVRLIYEINHLRIIRRQMINRRTGVPKAA